MRRFLASSADHVVCNTRAASRCIGGFSPGVDVRYIPNPVSAPKAVPLPWSSPAILTVGRLSAEKDYHTLLAAFAGASLEGWRLAVVGSGEQESELRGLADQLGITKRVDWYGFVRDPFPFYRSAQIFVLPSRFEGMPNALLEAMSFSLPCVVSDGSEGFGELIEHGRSGLIFPGGDALELSRALVDRAVKQRCGRGLAGMRGGSSTGFQWTRCSPAGIGCFVAPPEAVAARMSAPDLYALQRHAGGVRTSSGMSAT